MIRELLGKRLTARSRKDLDDISERTGVSLKSCKRQYDNIKNIFKEVEDSTGGLVENIKKNFLLSEKLSKYVQCTLYHYEWCQVIASYCMYKTSHLLTLGGFQTPISGWYCTILFQPLCWETTRKEMHSNEILTNKNSKILRINKSLITEL